MPKALLEGAPESFTARFSIPKLFGWIAATSTMAALSLAFALGGFGAGIVSAIVGTVGLLFFGTIGAVSAVRLFDRREQVIIDKTGVFVRSHGTKRIGLRSIKKMTGDKGRLSLFVYKPSKYPIERWHRRLIYRVNGTAARDFFGDAWIWPAYLDKPLDAFAEAIWDHRPMTDFEKGIAETVAGWNKNGGPYEQPAKD